MSHAGVTCKRSNTQSPAKVLLDAEFLEEYASFCPRRRTKSGQIMAAIALYVGLEEVLSPQQNMANEK
jgi:hypothetical protein